jgi:glycosyltransferase involved in cell wall biosynthesis
MKVLIISASFFPKISPRSFRTTELVKELSRKGHCVDLFVPRIREEHDAFEQKYQNVKIFDLGSPKWKGANFGSSRPAVLLSRFINRLANLLFDLPLSSYCKLTKRVISKLSGYDLLITIAVPHSIHWGVSKKWRKSAENAAKTWVADCGDPFMHCDTDTFKKLPYFHYFENNFLKKADYVSVPFDDLKNFFNQKYIDKFRVIPQGFDFKEIKLAKYEKNFKPTFAFSGSVIPGIRDFFNLLDFLEANCEEY